MSHEALIEAWERLIQEGGHDVAQQAALATLRQEREDAKMYCFQVGNRLRRARFYDGRHPEYRKSLWECQQFGREELGFDPENSQVLHDENQVDCASDPARIAEARDELRQLPEIVVRGVAEGFYNPKSPPTVCQRGHSIKAYGRYTMRRGELERSCQMCNSEKHKAARRARKERAWAAHPSR